MNVFVITFLVSIKRDLLGDDSLSSFMTYFHDNSSEVWRQSFPQYHTICPPSVITQLFTNHSKYILLQHQKPLTTTKLRIRSGWQFLIKSVQLAPSSLEYFLLCTSTVQLYMLTMQNLGSSHLFIIHPGSLQNKVFAPKLYFAPINNNLLLIKRCSLWIIQFLEACRVELETKVKRRFAKVSIVSCSRLYLVIIASASQFHVYLLWGQGLFSIVS